jgi:hypothetical protein
MAAQSAVLRDRRAEMEAAMRTEEEELARLSEEARSKVYMQYYICINHTYHTIQYQSNIHTYHSMSMYICFSSVCQVLCQCYHTSLLNESAAIARTRGLYCFI